jgi:hypothetical protein
MIFYSPELNEFCLIEVGGMEFNGVGRKTYYTIMWSGGGADALQESFSKYAWYYIGEV